jgi:hypothetical protein
LEENTAMNQQNSPFIQGLTPRTPNVPVKRALPSLATGPVTTTFGSNKNPFLTALNNESAEFKEMYGVNRPLKQEMFLGYRDDKPMYGGSRLFLLY